jgi:hypothetical protein
MEATLAAGARESSRFAAVEVGEGDGVLGFRNALEPWNPTWQAL